MSMVVLTGAVVTQIIIEPKASYSIEVRCKRVKRKGMGSQWVLFLFEKACFGKRRWSGGDVRRELT